MFLVDDHPLVRKHLTALLQNEAGLGSVWASVRCADGLRLLGRQEPDLVILDISLKHFSGLELLRCLKASHPELAVLVLSMHDESLYAGRRSRPARPDISPSRKPPPIFSWPSGVCWAARCI